MADTVDHNIPTIDGHGTFHSMGILASVTLGGRAILHNPRGKISVSKFNNIGKIKMSFYGPGKFSDLVYESLNDVSDVIDDIANTNLLQETTWL